MESRIKRLFRSKSQKLKEEKGHKKQPQAPGTARRHPDGAVRGDPVLRAAAYEALPAGGEPVTGTYPLRGNGEGSAPILSGRERSLRQTGNGSNGQHRATKSDVPVPSLPLNMAGAQTNHRQSASMGNNGNAFRRKAVPGTANGTNKTQRFMDSDCSQGVSPIASERRDAAGNSQAQSAIAPTPLRKGNYNEAIADRNIGNSTKAVSESSGSLDGKGIYANTEREFLDETAKSQTPGQGITGYHEPAAALVERARKGESPPPRRSSKSQAASRGDVSNGKPELDNPLPPLPVSSSTVPETDSPSSKRSSLLDKPLPPVPTSGVGNTDEDSKGESTEARQVNLEMRDASQGNSGRSKAMEPSLQGIVDLSDTVDTTVSERVAPAVTHETVTKKVHHSREEVITREIHHHDVYHRIQPIIDVEVLPPRHFLPVEGGGLEEVSADDVPGRQGHWVVAETVSKLASDEQAPDNPPRFTARKFGPTEGETYTTVSPEGVKQTHQTWIHPPVLETGGMETGQTWPVTFEDTLAHRPKKDNGNQI